MPTADRETLYSFDLDLDSATTRTLGLQWNSSNDQFVYSVSRLEERERFTKRFMLSDLSRVFDPLGALAPTMVVA